MAEKSDRPGSRVTIGALCVVGAVLALAVGVDERDQAMMYVLAGGLFLVGLYQFAVAAIARGVRESRD